MTEQEAKATQEQPEATLTIDDVTYAVKDLSDEAKYSLQIIEDLRQQMGATRAKFDQLSMAEKGFTEKLRELVKAGTEEEK